MTTTIGLLTTDAAALRGRDRDTGPLSDALRRDGLRVGTPVWHDPAVDWSGYDLLIIRTPWDYSGRAAEFMAWLDRASRVTRVLNAPELIRWNIDKRYLDDFVALGVPCLPTTFCTTAEQVDRAVASLPARVVVKPSVSAGSRDTGLFAPGDPGAAELARRILAAGKTVLVQPAAEHVITGGETALFFFNGDFSHAFHKGPILAPGGGYAGGSYQPRISGTEPSGAELLLGKQVLAAIADIAAGRGFADDARLPLYARVDLASDRGETPQVLEVEVFEPAYMLDVAPEAAGAFVRAVRAR
ncbi:RimK family alpha-L-glutamate ligase [Actinoplanes sp. N902-109]|uniref:ATP-grasp domain-containing protein n=1 Tax=Actinoplanes sp. (strain N902-109) TaxID=649831 RepID=UPI000329653D|nr:hypothetical protein [Actinoplanes sp. N902-109]AGL18895.1 hypothetical protein L083_5385 [Actinoplanes sp. N902-109]